MPAIKCPACGCRHLQAVTACHNCGRPLEAAPDLPVSTSENLPASSSDDEVESYKRFIAGSARASQKARDKDLVSVEQELPAGSPRSTRVPPERQLVRVGEQRPEARPRETNLQPYATTFDVTLPDPFTNSRSQELGDVLIEDEHRKRDKLPWYFLGIRPALSGVVMHIDSKEEIFNNPDMLSSLACQRETLLKILFGLRQLTLLQRCRS